MPETSAAAGSEMAPPFAEIHIRGAYLCNGEHHVPPGARPPPGYDGVRQVGDVVRELEAVEASGTRVVLLVVDSLGGDVVASHALSEALFRFCERGGKVLAYVERAAESSAASYILAADYVVAHRQARIAPHLPFTHETAADDDVVRAMTGCHVTELATRTLVSDDELERWLEGPGGAFATSADLGAGEAMEQGFVDFLGNGYRARELALDLARGRAPSSRRRERLAERGDRPEWAAAALNLRAVGAFSLAHVTGAAGAPLLPEARCHQARYDQSMEEYSKQGFSKEEAHAKAVRDANDVVREVLPPHDIADKPSLMRDRNTLGSLALFVGHANKMWQLYYRRPIADIGRTFRSSEATVGDKVSVVAKFAGRMLATSIVNGVIAEFIAGAGQQDDETREEWIARKALSGMSYPLPPILSQLVQAAGDYAISGKARKPSVRSAPGVEFLWRISQDSWKALEGDDDAGKRAVAAVEILVGLGVYAPTRQVHHTLGYAYDLATGQVQPRGVGDVAGGVIYGEDPNRREENPATWLQEHADDK